MRMRLVVNKNACHLHDPGVGQQNNLITFATDSAVFIHICSFGSCYKKPDVCGKRETHSPQSGKGLIIIILRRHGSIDPPVGVCIQWMRSACGR